MTSLALRSSSCSSSPIFDTHNGVRNKHLIYEPYINRIVLFIQAFYSSLSAQSNHLHLIRHLTAKVPYAKLSSKRSIVPFWAVERRHSPSANALKACFEILSLAAAIDRGCASRLAPHKLSEGQGFVPAVSARCARGLSPHALSGTRASRAISPACWTGLERDGFPQASRG